MATDLNQRRRHRILDKLFREEDGYTVIGLAVTLEDDYNLNVSERTIKADIKAFKEDYGAVFDESLPKDGKAKRYRYSDRDFSIFDRILSDEDKRVLADLLGRIREYEIDPNYAFFISLLEHVVTHRSAKDLDLDIIQFSNNSLLKGLDEWFRPLLNAITDKKEVIIGYRPYGKDCREFIISPYLLKQFNDRWFLIARVESFPNLTTFAIDRIESLRASDNSKYIPADFEEINRRFSFVYGISGAFDKEPVKSTVVLKVASNRIGYIDTKPISPCQEIEKMSNNSGWYRLTIPNIIINKELVSLILSFGDDIEVISPASLRDEMETTAREVLSFYSVK